MKKLLYLFCFTVLVKSTFAFDLPKKILEEIESRNAFKLRELALSEKLSSIQKLYVQGILNNAFAKNVESIKNIEEFLKKAPKCYDDTLYSDILQTQLDNFQKTMQYKKAAEIGKMIVKNCTGVLKEKEIKDIKNSIRIYSSIAQVQPIKVECGANSVLPFHRDIANLINIKVQANDYQVNGIYDTGANISCITDSVAKKMGLTIFKDTVTVQGILGNELNARMGYAKEIQIASVKIKNMVFMVFPNEAFTFGKQFKLDFIIGFPVIESFGAMEFDLQNNNITLTDKVGMSEVNMFLDGFTPVIKAGFKSEDLLFTFDSGAKETHFNKCFYSILAKNPEISITQDSVQVGGAGGMQTKHIDKMKEIKLNVAQKDVTLHNSIIMKEFQLDNTKYIHGNLGQDVMSFSKKYIMDFKNMIFRIIE